MLHRFEIGGAAEARAILALLSRAFSAIGPQHPTLINYVVLAYVLAARCLMLVDRATEAVAALDEALRLRPGDVAIQEARDVVISSRSTEAAESFERVAVKLVSALYQEQGRTVTVAHRSLRSQVVEALRGASFSAHAGEAVVELRTHAADFRTHVVELSTQLHKVVVDPLDGFRCLDVHDVLRRDPTIVWDVVEP